MVRYHAELSIPQCIYVVGTTFADGVAQISIPYHHAVIQLTSLKNDTDCQTDCRKDGWVGGWGVLKCRKKTQPRVL